eukprot:COSAG05_NODE_9155_length_643_cov_1.602941_1_plen_183_part_01
MRDAGGNEQGNAQINLVMQLFNLRAHHPRCCSPLLGSGRHHCPDQMSAPASAEGGKATAREQARLLPLGSPLLAPPTVKSCCVLVAASSRLWMWVNRTAPAAAETAAAGRQAGRQAGTKHRRAQPRQPTRCQRGRERAARRSGGAAHYSIGSYIRVTAPLRSSTSSSFPSASNTAIPRPDAID